MLAMSCVPPRHRDVKMPKMDGICGFIFPAHRTGGERAGSASVTSSNEPATPELASWSNHSRRDLPAIEMTSRFTVITAS
jgi:hypothetical protein